MVVSALLDASRKRQIAKIHVLMKRLELGEDVYRDYLEMLTGKRSTAAMDSAERFKVIDRLELIRERGP